MLTASFLLLLLGHKYNNLILIFRNGAVPGLVTIFYFRPHYVNLSGFTILKIQYSTLYLYFEPHYHLTIRYHLTKVVKIISHD